MSISEDPPDDEPNSDVYKDVEVQEFPPGPGPRKRHESLSQMVDGVRRQVIYSQENSAAWVQINDEYTCSAEEAR